MAATKKAELQQNGDHELDTDHIFNRLIVDLEPFVEVVPVEWPGFKGLRIGAVGQALLELEYEPSTDQFYIVVNNFKVESGADFQLEPIDWRVRPDQHTELLTLAEKHIL